MNEKRVFCFEVEVNCRHLHFGGYINGKTVLHCVSDTSKDWKDITEKDCKNCKKARYLGLPREQAIEKIAKALFSFMWQGKYSWDTVEEDDKKSFRKSAEAALNALLEGKDDEQ